MRAAIFDLDGTLCDSAPDIARALNAALVEVSLAPFDLAGVTAMVGAGAKTLVHLALIVRGAGGNAALAETVHARFIAHYHAHPCVETRLYPGTREALVQLVSDGWRLGLCTNKPQALADEVVKALGIADLFGSIVGGRDGVALKPARDMVDAVLAALGVGSTRAVFVGDSAADVGAARAAGLPVIVLAHGYNDGSFEALGAHAVLAGFNGLVRVVNSLAA